MNLIKPRDTAPATLACSTEVAADTHPQWISLNRLPGFMWQAIRAMGAAVFSPLTSTALERIEVIAHLSGHGPHSRQALDATAERLRRRSAPSNILEYSSDRMNQIFGAHYQAQAVQFEDSEHTYLLVKDARGSYIYRWPSADTRRQIDSLQRASTFIIERK